MINNEKFDKLCENEEDFYVVDLKGNEESGYQIHVDGDFRWYCETLQDVHDQIEHSFDQGFFDENTIFNF